jgi:hypothetical protein
MNKRAVRVRPDPRRRVPGDRPSERSISSDIEGTRNEPMTAVAWANGAGEGIRTLDPNLGKVIVFFRHPIRVFATLRQLADKKYISRFFVR